MAAKCPLCDAVLDDPREACPSCGSTLASESLKLQPEYERRPSRPESFEGAAPRGELLIDADLGEVNAPAPVIASAAGIARMDEAPKGPYIDRAEVERLA